MCVTVTQSCPTLCDSMDCNLPGSSVHGILQARILEWVVIPFSTLRFTESKCVFCCVFCSGGPILLLLRTPLTSKFLCLSLLPSTTLWRMRPTKERSCQVHGLIVLPPLSKRTSTVWVVKTLNDSLLWEESSKYAYCVLSLYKRLQKLVHHLLKRIPFDSHTNYIFKKKKGFGWIPLNLVFFSPSSSVICVQTFEKQVL